MQNGFGETGYLFALIPGPVSGSVSCSKQTPELGRGVIAIMMIVHALVLA